MATIERLLLLLLAEGRPSNAPKMVREATTAPLRDLKSLEEDASFKAQKIQFLLDATLGFMAIQWTREYREKRHDGDDK